MDPKEKRQAETFLVKNGWPGLQADGNPSVDLIQFMADVLNAHKPYENRFGEWIDQHKCFRDLLNEATGDERTEMYNALAPKLKFKPLALAQYDAMIAEKAGRMVSQRRMRVEGPAPKPIEVGGAQYLAAPAAVATQAMATLRCHRCQKVARFVEDTMAGAMIAARKAGWTREKGINKECCPQCSVAEAETLVRLSNTEVMPVYDRRKHLLDA